jgi:DNA (cytosine-5)-methyltransferase 1
MALAASPTYLDLFSGCGGISLGFRKAGYQPLLAIDWDQAAVHCYNDNLSSNDRLLGVRRDLSMCRTHADVAELLDPFGIRPGSCDVLAGGPPCQSFSMVGRTKVRALSESSEALRAQWDDITETRTNLFEAYALFLEYLAPRWFLFENVPAIKSHRVFERIIERFNNLQSPAGARLGYVLHASNYLASDYGVPQQRRRFLMVGYKEDSGIRGWTPPKAGAKVNVSDAISDLPGVSCGHRIHRIAYEAEPQSEYQRLMRGPAPDRREYPLYNHITRTHNPDDVALFGRMRPGAKFSDDEVQQAMHDINPEHKLLKYAVDKFQDKLHKLDPDRPSWTVTAHLQKDCYKFIHYSQPRTVSVREAARLQSFPDWFVFPPSLGPAFRLIGNAVPPLLAQAFAESFRRCDPRFSATGVQPIQLAAL